LCVDESWFDNEASPSASRSRIEDRTSEERKIIEAALAESRGRIAGPTGAAAKLRVPRSTLESRIRTLNIQKSHFKFTGA
jgi:transcriptional regulator with GAF, ATPase, and Fis domain